MGIVPGLLANSNEGVGSTPQSLYKFGLHAAGCLINADCDVLWDERRHPLFSLCSWRTFVFAVFSGNIATVARTAGLFLHGGPYVQLA